MAKGRGNERKFYQLEPFLQVEGEFHCTGLDSFRLARWVLRWFIVHCRRDVVQSYSKDVDLNVSYLLSPPSDHFNHFFIVVDEHVLPLLASQSMVDHLCQSALCLMTAVDHTLPPQWLLKTTAWHGHTALYGPMVGRYSDGPKTYKWLIGRTFHQHTNKQEMFISISTISY